MVGHRADAHPRIVGSSVDWSAALMEQGFDGLRRLTSDAEDIRIAHERYAEFRTQVDSVIHGADRIEFVFAAVRTNRSGRQDEALVIVTDSMVIVSGAHRAVMGVRSVTDIFARPVLTVTPGMLGPRRAIELQADGRRTKLILSSTSATLEAALISLGVPED
jgi:hypothetical protein